MKKGGNNTMFQLVLLTSIFSLFLVPMAMAEDEPMDQVTIVKLDSAKGRHVTTRTTIRHVWRHEGIWFVSYGTGGPESKNVYRASRDGVMWSERKERPDGAWGYFDGGASYAYLSKGGPVGGNDKIWAFKHWISTAKLQGESIQWGARVEFFKEPSKHMYFYYIEPRVDSTGRICMTMRHVDHTKKKSTIVWFHSKNPGDLTEWDGPVEIIAGETPEEGADGHQCVPLEDGKGMVIARTAAGHFKESGPKGGFYARLFNGSSWEKQHKIDTSDGTGGSDRRLSATFDAKAKVLHLVYTDGEKRLVYRTCKPPYGLSDWSEPTYPVEGKCFTQCVGLDRSINPARPVVVYGLQKHSDGGRMHVGELYLIRHDESGWSEPLLVSEKDRDDNWYPNLLEDCSGEIGVLYLRNFYGGENPKDIETPWDVMFAKLECVKEAAFRPLPGITDVLVDAENCRGAHITTRPHNRKVLYHAPSKTWFVFYGTGHWLDKLGDAGLEKEMIAWRASKDGQTFSPMVPAVVGNGHSSSTDILLVGNRIFLTETRWGYWRQKAGIPWKKDGKAYYHLSTPEQRMFFVPYEVFLFDIIDGQLVAGKEAEALPGDAHVGHAGPHYGSITRDTNGYLWVTARAQSPQHGFLATWVSRTIRPDDITAWEPHHVLFKSSGPGTHAPQIIALDEGRVACVLFVKHEKMTVVYLYDPNSRTWDEPHIIGKGYQSKRACAVFDPGSRRIHVVYTDAVGDACHRALTAPYGPSDWSPLLDAPGTLVAEKAGANKGDDDLSLSVNPSQNPAPLALVHRGPDLRLHLRYYDGKNWSPKDVKIGLQDEAWNCDESSVVADFSHGLGFVYWRQWKDPKVREEKDGIGQLRFCLVKDVAALFVNK